MRIPAPTSRRKARIEIIPLIDIIFFLLATFVMVSLSMVKNQAVSVNLPVSKTSTAQDRQDSAAITITEAGDLYFDKERLGMEELRVRLQSFKTTHPDPKIFIHGDEKAFFGKAITVLDEVRKLGITKVAIQTKARETPK